MDPVAIERVGFEHAIVAGLVLGIFVIGSAGVL